MLLEIAIFVILVITFWQSSLQNTAPEQEKRHQVVSLGKSATFRGICRSLVSQFLTYSGHTFVSRLLSVNLSIPGNAVEQ